MFTPKFFFTTLAAMLIGGQAVCAHPFTNSSVVNISSRATVPNPFTFTFTPAACATTRCTMFIVARSFAAFMQRVQMTVPGATCTLLGTGENVAMTTTGTPSGSQSCEFGAGSFITFSFTTNGPTLPVILTPTLSPSPFPGSMDVGIVSEDSVDNDDNDTFLTMTLTTSTSVVSAVHPSADIAVVSALGLQNFAAQGGMMLHASIEYSTGLTSDIDFAVGYFSESSTWTSFVVSTESWGKVTGVITDDTTTASHFNFVSLKFYFTDSKLVGMEGTSLSLRGFLRYSKTAMRPTGTQSASWVATLEGSNVTAVAAT